MNSNSFTANFIVEQTPMQVFDAIIKVNEWWSEDVTEPTSNLNDEFTYRHKNLHYSRHKITELVAGKKVTWLTLDSSINFTAYKQQWNNRALLLK